MVLERALIGGLLLSQKNIVQVMDTVKPEDFSSQRCAAAYSIIVSLWKQKRKVDLLTVSAEDPSLSLFLAEAIASSSPIGIGDYATRVATSARDRRILASLSVIAKMPTPDDKLGGMLTCYQQELQQGRKGAGISDILVRFKDRVAANRKNGGGISTGFEFLDEMYVFYAPGHIWTMGAFTSVGKTAMMVQKICNLLQSEDIPKILIISTEMTEEQLVSRILANLTGVHSFRIISGNYRHGEEEIVEERKKLLAKSNMEIYDDIYTLSDIEMAFRRADLQGGVDVGFIDYVQNCQVPEAASEYQAGSILAKSLQKLAKDIRCTLVCLSQVSNDVGRGNTDQLELKGAGEWAAVSDVGVMLQRNKQEKTKLKYQIKKNRHGALVDYIFEYENDFSSLYPVCKL